MTRRTKSYIAFDGDADLMSYRTIQGWSADPRHPFVLNDAHELNYARDDSLPESICRQLQERLDVSRNFVLIVGSATNKNRKGIMQYEIRYALRNVLPIFLVFKGYSSTDGYDWTKLWANVLYPMLPLVLREWSGDKYCLLSPFTREVIVGAIEQYSNVYLPEKGYSWKWTV